MAGVPSEMTVELAFLRLGQLLHSSGATTQRNLRPLTFVLTDGASGPWSFDPRNADTLLLKGEHPRPAGVLFLTTETLKRLIFSRDFDPQDPLTFQGNREALFALFGALRAPTSWLACRTQGAPK